MSYTNRWRQIAGCVPIIFATACIGHPDDYTDEVVDSEAEALVHWSSAVNPPQRGGVHTGALTPLFSGSDRPDVRLGVNNIPPDLNQWPRFNTTLQWLNDVTGRTDASAVVFKDRLEDAIADADAARARIDNEWVETAEDIETFADALNVEVTHTTPEPRHFSYVPERVRWLDREDNPAAQYSDPPGYFELRQRGALTYCAAKQAFANGGGQTRIMGRKSLADINVLGNKVSFFTLEPTVALAAPLRSSISSTNDGAQAFAIPMTVGVRVAPISILPTLPEIRTPVTYVMGDSEVITQSKVNNRNRWWQTSTHADMFVSSNRSLEVDPKPTKLFQIGPVAVMMDLYFNLHTVSCPYATIVNGVGPLDVCSRPQDFGHLRVPRLYTSATPNLNYPPTRTGGYAGPTGELIEYNDDFWVFEGENANLGGNADNRIDRVFADPLYPRAYLDNDKQLEVRTGLRAQAAILTGLDEEESVPYLGDLRLEVTAEGAMRADADVVHTIRDEVIASRRGNREFTPWKPEATISVTPRTEPLVISGSMNAEAWIHVNLPFIGMARIGGTLFEVDFAEAPFPSKSWPEQNRLRISTLTSWSQPTSHFPNATPFQSMGEPLSTCMTTAQPSGTLAPPCPSISGAYPNGGARTAPTIPLCVVGPDRVVPPDFDDDERRCSQFMMTFLRGGRNAIFDPPTNALRARVIENRATADAFKEALRLCALVTASEDKINRVIDIKMCNGHDASSPKEPVQLVGDAQDGPDMDANICAP